MRLFDVLDHVVALVNGGEDEDANLQRLCVEHHRDKTAADMGHKVVAYVGSDGWPLQPREGEGGSKVEKVV